MCEGLNPGLLNVKYYLYHIYISGQLMKVFFSRQVSIVQKQVLLVEKQDDNDIGRFSSICIILNGEVVLI